MNGADPYAGQSSLGHLPQEKWEFDDSVASVFRDMLERSIPELATMRKAVTQLGAECVREKTDIVDLGCSQGDAIEPFVRKFGAQNRFVLCDSSEPMLAACRARFSGYTETGVMRVQSIDLRTSFPKVRSSLTLSILTLQFVPIEFRQRVVQSAFDSLTPGGAFILVEKVLGSCAELHERFVRHYQALKAEHGYTREEIERKALSLEGVLVPVATAWNEDLLHTAGFGKIDCFYRWMNFAGWIAVKK